MVEIDAATGEPGLHRLITEPTTAERCGHRPHDRPLDSDDHEAKSVDPIVLRSNWDDAYQFVPVTAKPAIDCPMLARSMPSTPTPSGGRR